MEGRRPLEIIAGEFRS